MSKEIISSFYNSINNDAKETSLYWKDHKKQLDFLCDKSLSLLPDQRNAIILGIGTGQDLPLTKITDRFQSTILLDIDKDSLQETKKSLPMETQLKVKNVVKDLTNADRSYTKQYILAIIKDNDQYKANSILEKLLKDDAILPKSPLQEKFQFVISSTVSSQLATPLLLITETRSRGILTKKLMKQCTEFANKATENHVMQIYNLLDENTDSLALITSEQYVWSVGESYESSKIGTLIKEPKDMLTPTNQQEFENSGLVIAGRITEDMLKNFDIVHSDTWIWQFNASRHYLVKGWIVKKSIK
ncbi:hypothetical protein J7E38_21095 [Bacillus sp. ISL-35]|uniref:hypothetical protein n=1 Tax=Bacillus sp. ISL-35 TaxID=2819122 RepID=UPI001BEBCEB6|nr:hypothetical protein [Bacillus sp. ISL-35]MBT2681468.1 hypothetical protein [Bacillus sp. ISL-35]MBT2701935.1 hypothetical protein [Chryseobacterium sp. ISL-80]